MTREKIKNKEILIFEDQKELLEEAVKTWLEISKKTIKDRGSFHVALSGGKTPVKFYQKLAEAVERKLWDNTHVFIVDERFVPFNHPASNYGMIEENLLSRVKIPRENVHPVLIVQDDLPHTANEYERALRVFFKLNAGEMPVFDLIMLGIGKDGHTASLFPEAKSTRQKRLVTTVSLSSVKKDRVTITFPVINNARNVMFLVCGSNKAHIVKKVFESREDHHDHKKKTLKTLSSASKVTPKKGNLFFYLDKQAGAELPLI
ncbi:MAG: 6-phosphogluconolactonase [Candidatus Omnitrophica bacterium]|nr:6-phosphogluconolactonase [Candidatus Omnitrophota bacterium]